MELKKGTSLIELIVVIGLVSLLALALSAIMLTTITSNNRVRRLTQLKQVGGSALNQIQTLIRNAQYIESCDNDNSLLTTINPDGHSTDLALESGRIASNSGTYLTPPTLTVTDFTLTCDDPTEPKLIYTRFTLTHAIDTGSDRENTSYTFETTTSLRND